MLLIVIKNKKMQLSDQIDLIAVVLAACAFFASLFVAYRQTKLAKNSNSFPVTIELFREFRDPEFKKHLNFVLNEFPKLKLQANTIYSLPDEAKNSVLTVSHYFDNLGLMIAYKAIDKHLVISFLGGTALRVWEVLYLNIKAERKTRANGLYQEFFENLVYEIKQNPPEKAMKRLALKRVSN